MSAILLIAFRRWKNIDLILDQCAQSGASRIYIHLDAARNPHDIADVGMVKAKIDNYRNSSNLDVKILVRDSNVGCAVAMISSLSTILSFENELVVLEDDCIPSLEFFKFMADSFEAMGSNSDIAVACGAQFAPISVTGGTWSLSSYPLNWGWGITRQQWFSLSADIYSKKKLNHKSEHRIPFVERTYWDAGSRRALDGFSDVWDTLLVREMIKARKYAILPGENLVTNLGVEEFALHTGGNQPWTRHPIGNYVRDSTPPKINHDVDSWLRENIFKVSFRHIFTTRLTKLKDKITQSQKFAPLSDRFEGVSSYFA